jgi:hypothetical protein
MIGVYNGAIHDNNEEYNLITTTIINRERVCVTGQKKYTTNTEE